MSEAPKPNPAADPNVDGNSLASISVLAGTEVTLWGGCNATSDTMPTCELVVVPIQPVVIGRGKPDSDIKYLDPAYRPTRVVPCTRQSILRYGGEGRDISVSRGHFMLRGAVGGILLVNGVPRRGGGIRPPLNGTWLLAPERRPLAPEEEYLIVSGTAIVLRLPNGTELRIAAK